MFTILVKKEIIKANIMVFKLAGSRCHKTVQCNIDNNLQIVFQL